MNSGVDRRQLNLAGAGVLITRPLQQATATEARVRAAGGVPYVFPSLEIHLSPASALGMQLERIRAGDILIFVSRNAVRGVFQELDGSLYQQISSAQLAAVGSSTQAALEAQNLFVAITPESEQQNSEGLLQHPLLQSLRGRHVYIVRGQAGRETLREEIIRRGAQVEYIEAYRREIPRNYDSRAVVKALQRGQIKFVMITSLAAFENLRLMLGTAADSLLEQAQLVVPGPRVARKILAQHAYTLCEAENASDEEMLAAITRDTP